MLLIVLASLDRGTTWDGVDTAVVGRYATELGRAPRQPLINLQGDSLLFAFTVSAAIAGFAAGYYWRQLFGSKDNAASSNGIADQVTGAEAKKDV